MTDKDIPGARYHAEMEQVEYSEMMIPMERFIQFLKHTSRSTKCPLCPHQGEWLVHAHEYEGQQMMNIYTMGDGRENNNVYPFVALECPRCGFTPMTSAFKLKEFVESIKDE
tara:strand:+ start:361 stop:696 length:336 start_codon:yes stop_codon:yes gene_type:complete